MIGRLAVAGRNRDADLELMPLNFANRILFGVWLAENIEDECIALPGKNRTLH